MDFIAKVHSGKYDKYLLGGNGDGKHPDDNPILQLTDKLEEAWTPKLMFDRNKDWIIAGEEASFSVNLSESWRFMHYAYHYRGPVRNVVNNLTMFTGTPEFTFKKKKDQRRWEDIAYNNGFPHRWEQIVKDTYLFNDYFTIKFEGDKASPKIRNLEPYHIEKVEVDPSDPETPISYHKQNDDSPFPAEKVVHHIVDRIGNGVRGIPIFNVVLRELVYYIRWLEDIYYYGHIRARIPVIRKVRGSGGDVTTESTRLQYLPGPGRVPVENDAVEWQFPQHWTGLSDARIGWETFCQAIAAAMNLPYFLVSSDYRNNSLASTLTASDPTVRLIRSYRSRFEKQFKDIIDMGLNQPGTDVDVKWPPIIERDKEKLAKAFEIGIRQGAVSAQTMCKEVFGFDWEEEKKRIEDETKNGLYSVRQPQQLMGPDQAGGEGEEEI